MTGRLIVAKIGTSSLTDGRGAILPAAIDKLCAEVAGLRARGDRVVIVTSGAIAAGLPVLGLRRTSPDGSGDPAGGLGGGPGRPGRHYDEALAAHGLVGGQVLLAPLDFVNRQQYLHARQTLSRAARSRGGAVVNENDAIADDEIRFGDNDRLAALVAHLLRADLLVLLTDTPGLLTADPRVDSRGVADRGDRRGRPPAGGHGRRRPARRGAAAGWRPSWRRPRSPPGRGSGS